MKKPFFNFYVSDYEAKTAHLTIEEDGAYNRLLRLMWMSPDCMIPDDDEWIIRRMRVDVDTYKRVVIPIIDEFMQRKKGKVFSERLLSEFKKINDTFLKRSKAGKKGGRPQAAENKQKDEKAGFYSKKGGPKQPEPEPEPYISSLRSDIIGGGGDAREGEKNHQIEKPQTNDDGCETAEVLTEREMVLSAIGVDPVSGMDPKSCRIIGGIADMEILRRWKVDLGLSIDDITELIREIMAKKPDGAPSTFKYFTSAMQRQAALKKQPKIEEITDGEHYKNSNQASGFRSGNGRSPSVRTAAFAALAAKIQAEEERNSGKG